MPQNQTLPQVWLCVHACVHVGMCSVCVCFTFVCPCTYTYVCVSPPLCVCVTCATHPLLPSPLAVAGLPFNAQPKKGVKFNSKEDSGNTEKLAQVQTYSTYQCYSVAMGCIAMGCVAMGCVAMGCVAMLTYEKGVITVGLAEGAATFYL